jgi:hypothetical protein
MQTSAVAEPSAPPEQTPKPKPKLNKQLKRQPKRQNDSSRKQPKQRHKPNATPSVMHWRHRGFNVRKQPRPSELPSESQLNTHTTPVRAVRPSLPSQAAASLPHHQTAQTGSVSFQLRHRLIVFTLNKTHRSNQSTSRVCQAMLSGTQPTLSLIRTPAQLSSIVTFDLDPMANCGSQQQQTRLDG